MVNISIEFPVSGYARGAASARLLTAAPRPWMSGLGVCPRPVQLRAGTGDAAVAIRPDGADDQQYTRAFERQTKHDPGSTDLRPPV